ncbi:MAG: hypothetical protein HY400_00380, partial [Elusimicrobia bacterium]|nr:hypothetical protein [Elusimicrobiota bacterium]
MRILIRSTLSFFFASILAVGYTSLKRGDIKPNPKSESVISKPVLPAAPLGLHGP